MEENMQEYITFMVKTEDGTELELAAIDEFEFEHKNYVIGAAIHDDMIDEEECYIYKVKTGTEEFEVEKIRNQYEYDRITRAYMEME